MEDWGEEHMLYVRGLRRAERLLKVYTGTIWAQGIPAAVSLT